METIHLVSWLKKKQKKNWARITIRNQKVPDHKKDMQESGDINSDAKDKQDIDIQDGQ